MKKIIFLLLVSIASLAQDRAITLDTTGNAYVAFLRPDSVMVLFQGRRTVFSTDGLFAKDFMANNLRFIGFVDLKKKGSTLPPPPPDPIILPSGGDINDTSKKTAAFGENEFQRPRYMVEPLHWASFDESSSKMTINGMQGYDFAPFVANQREFYSYGDWNQEYLSVSGNKNVWEINGVKYFLSPPGYVANDGNMMDFDIKFPNFTVPASKMVIVQAVPSRELGVNNYLNKGITHAKNASNGKGFIFVSDEWINSLGAPPAYTSSQEDFDRWCENVDGDKLLSNFINYVYGPTKDIGYVMLNWEAVGNRWRKRQDKIIRCLKYWKEHEHTSLMSLWTVSALKMGRPVFTGLNIDFTGMLEYSGSLDGFRQKFGDYVAIDDTYSKYVEVGHVGSYMNHPIEQGIIHHYISEMAINKKFYPDKKYIFTFWHDIEIVDSKSLELGWVKVDYGSGAYFSQVKPRVPPSVMFNVGAWSMLGGGIDLWSDGHYWSDNKSFWGWGAKDLSMKDLPMKWEFIDNQNVAKYPSQSIKGVDWLMKGIWAVSENKKIVENGSDWVFVEPPTRSFHNKSALIAYKVYNGEALVLVLNDFVSHDSVVDNEFTINGVKRVVRTYGRFTSVVKLKL